MYNHLSRIFRAILTFRRDSNPSRKYCTENSGAFCSEFILIDCRLKMSRLYLFH